MNVKHVLQMIVISLCLIPAVKASAQVAGSTTHESATVSMTDIAMGWSAKKKFLGKTVYNEDQKKVGKINDIIIAPGGNASYIIVSAGGFVGLGKHNVAVPASSLFEQDGKLLLPGATKAAIKAMPQFEYEK